MNNDSARGYFILTLENLGCKEEINKKVKEIEEFINNATISEVLKQLEQ